VPGVVRWLHTYLSLVGFAALLFFAITGITLNHAGWFESGGERKRTWDVDVPRELLAADAEPDENAFAEWLRRAAGVHGDVYDFFADSDRISIVLKGPGYSVDADVDVAKARASVRETRLNAWAVLDDLHKGRDSGAAWAWVIDVSAVVMAIAALTGLWLLFYVKRRRAPGLCVTAIGAVVLALVAWLATP
jgi:hypothetical protein